MDYHSRSWRNSHHTDKSNQHLYGCSRTAYTLRWTISNPPCPASTDDVNITFNQNRRYPMPGLSDRSSDVRTDDSDAGS